MQLTHRMIHYPSLSGSKSILFGVDTIKTLDESLQTFKEETGLKDSDFVIIDRIATHRDIEEVAINDGWGSAMDFLEEIKKRESRIQS